MHKQKFLAQLRKALSGLPKNEIQERLTFYSEMIDDRMEEGLSEENAVLAVGSVDEIIAQVMSEIPADRTGSKQKRTKRRMNTWEILFLVLGSPIWLSLLIAAAAVLLSLYIALWSIVVSLWAVFASLVGCAFAGLAAGIILCCTGHVLIGVAMIGAGIACAGLSIFMFYGCRAATKGTLFLAKKMAAWMKKYCARKEDAQ